MDNYLNRFHFKSRYNILLQYTMLFNTPKNIINFIKTLEHNP